MLGYRVKTGKIKNQPHEPAIRTPVRVTRPVRPGPPMTTNRPGTIPTMTNNGTNKYLQVDIYIYTYIPIVGPTYPPPPPDPPSGCPIRVRTRPSGPTIQQLPKTAPDQGVIHGRRRGQQLYPGPTIKLSPDRTKPSLETKIHFLRGFLRRRI